MSARLPAQDMHVCLCSLPSSTCRCRGRVHLRVGQKAVSFAQDCREVQRAERVARQLACKTFDQMAGELKA